ncbi:hypothetical protein PEBR_35366 [Penicillium brasilianum]|uniref:Zn(2)-C6 fungal-type domain-containing protein n=1 Tax=Penicillium brasilianum TaxID=104259 RepID=A0A1S9RCU1_PENBI|nr:hypothetical protein PEBR_35366 [Penicillium brasilianum]
MDTTRQERKSCEACRARKLRCSGEKTGCSRCRGLSLPCRFKDKGAPGRPRKRVRQESQIRNSPSREERTLFSSSSNFSTAIPQMDLLSPDGVSSLMGTADFDSLSCTIPGICGLDSLRWEMLDNGDLPMPIESWQTLRQDGLHDPRIPLTATDAYVSPVSFSQSCKCDEEVSTIVRTLSRAEMSHEVVQTLRAGISLAERLLTCSACYDTSKPPRVTVQNVLLIGHLMFEVTASYQKYVRWLNKHCSELDAKNESETVYLDSGLGIPSGLGLQISGEKFLDVVMQGLQSDSQSLVVLGKSFEQRQRKRHMAGHEACPNPEGRCRRKEFGDSHDPLDVCPHDPIGRKLVPCFRIVDEVQAMIKQVTDVVR